MKKLLFFIVCITVLCFQAIGQSQADENRKASDSQPRFPTADQFKTAVLDYRIFPASAGTFGYDILADNRLLIHQPTVPGLEGEKGFKSDSLAVKVALLVIEKIRNGEMPPSLTTEEMKKAGVLLD